MANATAFALIPIRIEKAVISPIYSTIGTIDITKSTADAFVLIPIWSPLPTIPRTEGLSHALLK
jgi:hypothetical protein